MGGEGRCSLRECWEDYKKTVSLTDSQFSVVGGTCLRMTPLYFQQNWIRDNDPREPIVDPNQRQLTFVHKC